MAGGAHAHESCHTLPADLLQLGFVIWPSFGHDADGALEAPKDSCGHRGCAEAIGFSSEGMHRRGLLQPSAQQHLGQALSKRHKLFHEGRDIAGNHRRQDLSCGPDGLKTPWQALQPFAVTVAEIADVSWPGASRE